MKIYENKADLKYYKKLKKFITDPKTTLCITSSYSNQTASVFYRDTNLTEPIPDNTH